MASKTRPYLIAFLLLLPLLASCLPAASPTTPDRPTSRRQVTPAQDQATTTVSWSFWGDPWELEVNRRVARAFQAEHPQIKLELIHQPWDQYFNWLETQWQQGQAPDVMFLNNVRGYAARGHLAPLDGYLQQDGFELADFYPRLLELFNFRGSYYGLPRDNDTKVIYYNRAIFEDAGLEPPRAGWTWTDLRNLANRLTRRDALGRPLVYGFAFETETWWRIWVWQNGGDILNDPFSPTLVRLGEPEAVDAIQFLADLVLYDRVTPPPDILRSSSRITQVFREGRAAMVFGGHGKIPVLAEEPSLKWDVVGLPRREQAVNLAGGAGYTISALSEQKEAAWALVRFLESEKGQAMFAESGLIVPARRSIREDSIFLRQQPYNAKVFTEEAELGRPNLNMPVAGEVTRLTEIGLAPVWTGQRSPAEAIADLVPQLQGLLEP
jgi:multiple sugar transport system substrate-binding protein